MDNSIISQNASVQTVCAECGTSIRRWASKIREKNFCSQACHVAYKNRTGFYKKNNHPRWKGGPIIVQCDHCGKDFSIKKSALRRGRGKYCSRECRRNAGSIVKNCESCGKEFCFKRSHDATGHGRYCSIKCRTIGYKERGLYDGEGNGNYRHGQCYTSEYIRQASHKRRVQIESNGGDYTLEEWKELCDQYGNRCLACGTTDELLTVDHVLPVSMGGTNDISNLQPLCKSCNSKKNNKHIDYR